MIIMILFLRMGTTFPVLSNDRETPKKERERLNRSASCFEIYFFNGLIFCKGYYWDHWIYSC